MKCNNWKKLKLGQYLENISITVFLITSSNVFYKLFYVFKKYFENEECDKLNKSKQSTTRMILTCLKSIFSNMKVLTSAAPV